MTDAYDDIIDLPRWEPLGHPRMPMEKRAAQFAPFAALSGHDEAISETARLTQAAPEADPEAARDLDERLALLAVRIAERPEVEVTYFVPDPRKNGGSYSVHRGRVRRIDETDRLIVFADGTAIPLPTVTAMRGAIFGAIDMRE